jgi:hypothetical protein
VDLGAVRGIGLEQIEDCTTPTCFIKFRTCAASGNPRGLLPELDLMCMCKEFFYFLMRDPTYKLFSA